MSVDELQSEFRWCIYCERAYHINEHRSMERVDYCAYSDCNALLEDSWDWDVLRLANKDYARCPRPNQIYSMFSVESD